MDSETVDTLFYYRSMHIHIEYVECSVEFSPSKSFMMTSTFDPTIPTPEMSQDGTGPLKGQFGPLESLIDGP